VLDVLQTARTFVNAYRFRKVKNAVFSDRFVWKNDSDWKTYFDLYHLGGILNPDFIEPYEVSIFFFDAAGKEICRKDIEVQFGQKQAVDVSLILKEKHQGSGTFLVFHKVAHDVIFGKSPSCLFERGYTSYQRRSDNSPLRSYVHGNLSNCALDIRTLKIKNTAKAGAKNYFNSQLMLDDCEFFELFLTNPIDAPLSFTAEFFDKEGVCIDKLQSRIPVQGLFSYSSQRSPSGIQRVKLTANFHLFRPAF